MTLAWLGWKKKKVQVKIKDSSNINEVIRALLNSWFFFYEKILHALKAPKALKGIKTQAEAQNANERISDYFPLRCF